jgi:hypothetical protein
MASATWRLSGMIVAPAAMFVTLLAAAVWLLAKVGVDLLSGEIRSWLPHLSRHLVTSASLQLPERQRDLLEQWEAELEEFADRPLAMLIVALRIWRDRKLIATEAAGELTGVAAEHRLVRQPGTTVVSIIGVAAHSGKRIGARALARTRQAIKVMAPFLILLGVALLIGLIVLLALLALEGPVDNVDLVLVGILVFGIFQLGCGAIINMREP